MKKVIWGSIWLCLSVMAAFSTEPRPPQITAVAFEYGDEPQWANPAFADSHWARESWRKLRFYRQNLWVRVWVDLPELSRDKPWALYTSGLFSAEIFWDGNLIGTKGLPGSSKAAEKPGPMDVALFFPPESMSPGRHLLALRLSSHYHQEPFRQPFHGLYFSEYRNYRKSILIHYLPALTTLSALFLAAIYFSGRFARNRSEKSLVWLVMLCLGIATQLLAESWRGFYSYTYNWQLFRLQVVMACTVLIGVALIAYLGNRLNLKQWRRYLGVGCVFALLIWVYVPGYDGKTQFAFAVFSLMATWLSVRACLLRHRDGPLVLVGISILTLCVFFSNSMFLDRYLYFGFLAFLVTLFIVEINALSRVTQARWVAESSLQRLELELIKKQIQPHFLMNTLTSLAEWFDAEPKTASAMLEAIAEVYRLLLEVADQRLIPLEKELELCQAYLKVMGYRRDHRYSLSTQGTLPGDSIPPAVLLTLLENALTHNDYGTEGAHFQFLLERSGENHIRMSLVSPLGQSALESEHHGAVQGGTGTAYVRARLREAFAMDWSFSDGVLGESQWQATIEIQAS